MVQQSGYPFGLGVYGSDESGQEFGAGGAFADGDSCTDGVAVAATDEAGGVAADDAVVGDVDDDGAGRDGIAPWPMRTPGITVDG